MRELRPGLFHWTTFHEGIGAPVSSYYVESAGALIDARVPDEGIESAFDGRATPQQAIITTGLHLRHADRFAEAFGCSVRAPAEARDRLADTGPRVPRPCAKLLTRSSSSSHRTSRSSADGGPASRRAR